MGDKKNSQIRPCPNIDMHHDEFDKWYWPITHLKEFCRLLKISDTGTKLVLRERVKFVLEYPNLPIPKVKRKHTQEKFNWAKESLSRTNIILENISFGPNVRGFFRKEIGPQFVCNSDFMSWMKSNIGATLDDAIEAWYILEQRKDDPEFRREIALCNNYLQYLRDARDLNEDLTLTQARKCWDYKKIRPAQNGIVIFEKNDLKAIN